MMSSEDSHAVGPSGVPYRTTPPSRKAPNKQLQAVFLRLSPSCGLTQARNHSSHAPRTQHTPSSALPTPAPRARRKYSFCCSRAARTSRTQATPGHTHMRHKPTRTTRTATRPLSLRSMRFGAWLSHAPEHSPSRQFMPRKRQTVTVTVFRSNRPATRPEGVNSPTKRFFLHTPPVLAPPYDWHLTHAAWNLQRRIEHGNTATPTLARALRNKHRVAIWCSPEPDEDFPQGWYTAKIIDPQTENHNQHLVQYDADGSTRLHTFMPVAGHTASGGRDRWTPAPPPEAPPCPACGSATKGGTGAGGTATYPYTPYHAKVARLAYTCVRCDSKCSAKNPATLARADPSSPRITEPLDCRPTPPRAPKPPPPQPPAGARQSPRLAALAALAPDADGHAAAPAQTAQARAHPPPAPPPRAANYRDHTDPRPCVADATLTYHNANGLAALGAGAAYLRDVALRLSDVHAVSETSWTDSQIDALQAKMKDEGHRLWAVAAKTRRTAKSGTAILAKATIAPRPGDGLVWAKPDGKAMAVALTIGDRPVYLLAAHLPHTDPERVAFLTTVADGVRAATAAHAQTPEGRPWARATHLWAADLNLTCNPTLDNETRRPGPTPEVARALDHLSQATGGTLKHYECYNEPHYERNIHYEFRGLLMPTALGALHKTSLLIHMPNA